MKFKDSLGQASTNLWRNKGRTILTIIAIFIGAFTISMTIGIKIGVNDYIDKQINNVGRNDLLQIVKKTEGSSTATTDGPAEYHAETGSAEAASMISQKDLTALENFSGLTTVKPGEYFSVDYITGASGKKFVLSASNTDGIDVDLKTGKQVSQNGNALEIDISPDYVKALGYDSPKAALNQSVHLGVSSQATGVQEEVTATIVGVRNPSIVNNGDAVVSEALAEKLIAINQTDLPKAMQGQYYYVTAVVKNPTDENVAKMKDTLANAGYNASTFADQVGMIHSTVDAITGVLTLFGGIALLAASFGIINTLFMSVQDRTREIGLMKAMGMGRAKVFASFSIEALLIGFWGSALGVLAALGGGALLNKIATDSFLTGLDGFQLVQFNFSAIFAIVAVIMLIAFLAGTLPANRAARLDPIKALRYE